MFAEEAKVQFEQNRLDYEQVELYRMVVDNAQIAQELSYQIEESEINFFEAAHLYDINPVRRAYCGYEGPKSRWALEPDIAASVFGSEPQAVIGPFALAEGYTLLFIDRFIIPELTDEVYQQIRDRKFNRWLETEIQRLQP
ncbi:MAG: peptidylprolyl isomerase [Phormidesmis sp. RL_2_1]|nr:peptidylprolyl isomerase [Phormidesmis sp. RL_2_1]